jgi:hypothetical protein
MAYENTGNGFGGRPDVGEDNNSMTTLHDIQKAVEKLPLDKLAKFRAWFEEFNASKWDEEIEQNVQVGKLDVLEQRALTDITKQRMKNRSSKYFA